MADNCARVEYGAIRHDISKFTGDMASFTFSVKVNGSLIDISDDTFFLRVEKSKGVTLFDLELGDGIAFLNDNKIQVTFSPAHTALLPDGHRCRYWLRWVRSAGDPETPVAGYLMFARNPTPSS